LALFDRLRRFFRSIEEIFETEYGNEPEEPERQRPPPSQPPPPDIPDSDSLYPDDPEWEQNFRDTWEYITGQDLRDPSSESDYISYRDIFYDTGILAVEDDIREIERLWDKFLRSFYLVSAEPGSVSREEFYSDSGLNRDRIDWEAWREVKRTP